VTASGVVAIESERDMAESAFTPALRNLLNGVPGVLAVVFVDGEGECIDYYGDVDPFDLKIAGAQLAPMHDEVARRLGGFLGAPLVHLRGERASYLYVPVSVDYYLVALLSAYASWWEALDDVTAARDDLRKEAGV